MAVVLSTPVNTHKSTKLVDFSRLSRSEIDAELQTGWDDLESGRVITLEKSIKNYNLRHRL